MAAPRHRVHVGALDDLAREVEYYRNLAPEQAPRLVALYRQARRSLRRHPLLHASIYGDYRRVVLVPFQAMVIYVTDGRSTDILAVFDCRQDPERLQSELRGRTF